MDNLTYIAFIAVTKDDVKLLNVTNFKDSSDRAVGMVPELVDKIIGLFKKDKKKDKDDEKDEDTTDEAVKDPEITDPEV